MIKAVLTIDDFPTKYTPAVVDFLEEKKICALMFAVGMQIEKYPENVIYALQHDMVVGNSLFSS